ncbi:MAG: EamA family transporter [Candidatus Poribacteria bacterium]|nr:EamA family transporter [Candidatus Poribacteria bacterium]
MVALLIAIWSMMQLDSLSFSGLATGLGITNGITYALGFFLWKATVQVSGVVVTTAILRLSMVIPITFAILIWHEIPSAWQILGIFLTCTALPLLSTNDPVEVIPSNISITGGLGAIVISLTFVNAGVGRLLMKIFNETCPVDEKPFYLFFLFGVTTFVFTIVCIYQKIIPTRWEYVFGILVGVSNFFQSVTFLVALDSIDALIVFPVSAASSVLFTTLVGVVVLKEKLRTKSIIGIILAVIALIFVNLKNT